jgi:hypothetical protein
MPDRMVYVDTCNGFGPFLFSGAMTNASYPNFLLPPQ